MARFRKRPVIIDAVRIKHRMTIKTREGTLKGYPGDWLITGVAGEKYPRNDDIFRATHEPVTPEAQDMMEEK